MIFERMNVEYIFRIFQHCVSNGANLQTSESRLQLHLPDWYLVKA
jgi:hypothetical protein